MNKGALIFKEGTPTHCGACPVAFYGDDDSIFCPIVYSWVDDDKIDPNCHVIELPEQKEEKSSEVNSEEDAWVYDHGYNDGFNACLHEILGTED